MKRPTPGQILVALSLPAVVLLANLDPSRLGALVERYCAAPKAERQSLRTALNQLAAPNTLRVECAADALQK
ncbi:hypothetical protein D3C81_1301900 [compost metagenome]